MKLIAAFFRLIRWPNLFFIVLAQTLFYYCIILPSLPQEYHLQPHRITDLIFILIIIASVFIAAGGYIINDYFDINIDQINKPGKMVVEKIISRRWAILWHIIVTTIGVVISIYISLKTNWIIAVANIVCTMLLWFYSTTFKKKLLSGNVIISLLTAWTLFVLYFVADIDYKAGVVVSVPVKLTMQRIYKFAALYGGFAFIISLVREVVKDMEDMEGDAKYNCKTMPIVWGIPASKVFVAVWLVVLTGALAVIQFYVLQLGWWESALYCFILVILPVIWVLRKLYKAQTSAQYHQLSRGIKLIMLTGILSMIFFRIYH
ncbi:geranylgeranylglycerol-phosphate geranylgeranyltransferase [Ferruginibacter lapsinanis]|uniref:geranylgeranylglycerol-phosphate geranylgeranyltransferase n=1 Tax=Ferruginibacter lapsinanis TaxID=563172 RepID=UPI001E3C8A1D|nr:geranylgeranylglycerol-phosphate geranylgeranyltransferase [Ferruginibacter lapsinanis]UEG49309.1 geranylgeranylglycerol-phosphate geranylgeranyltransferase [Ferruginibacter lapsinanis]